MPVIDAVATRPHYYHHLRPVMAALPAARRGTLYTGSTRSFPSWGYLDGMHVTTGRPPPGPDPVLCAAGNDLADCWPRAVVLFEHGAGQSYTRAPREVAYAGGWGRDAVRLFLAPREDVAERDRVGYPEAEAVAVGCPRLDELLPIRESRVPGPGIRTVTVSWHFEALVTGVPEAGSAWPHYGPEALGILAESEHFTLGHAHPRARPWMEPEYAPFNIPYVVTFEEVLAATDVFIVDNSSALYEAIACDVPVVVLDCPTYRPDVEHGLRFWEWADVGPRIGHRDDLLAAIDDALDPRWAAVRKDAANAVYANLGQAAERAVDEILTRWP